MVARQAQRIIIRNESANLIDLRAGALVEPDDAVAYWFKVPVDEQAALHLTGKANAADLDLCTDAAYGHLHGRAACVPQLARILLDPARTRRDNVALMIAGAAHPAKGVENNDLNAARSGIYSDKTFHNRSALSQVLYFSRSAIASE